MSKKSSKKFTFINHDEETKFECNLESKQCLANTKNNTRCKRKCVIGFEYCYSHLLSVKNLRIKPAEFGKGLFAQKRRGTEENEILFRKGAIIIEYKGELVDQEELFNRYGENTAPYGMRINKNTMLDAACERGVGSLVNHSARKANATFIEMRTQGKITGVKIVANKNIRNNVEILVNYGRSYKFNKNVSFNTK